MRAMPQPPVRPLDHGRLLRLGIVLQPDRTQAWRGPARDDRLQQRQRGGESSGDSKARAADISRWWGGEFGWQGSPRGSGGVADVAAESVLRAQPRQSHLGALLR